MDTIYIAILITFAILLYLHYRDHLTVEEQFLSPDYFQKPNTDSNNVAINLNDNKNSNFKNFGTIGDTPPNPICENCNLNYNCMNAPYTQVSDIYQNVCTRCSNPLNINHYSFNTELKVMGRSAGRGRVCRILSE